MKKSSKISKNGRIRLMLADNKGISEIANIMGLSYQRVKNVVKYDRLKAERDSIKYGYAKHKSIREIADKTGLRFTRVAAFVAHLKAHPGVVTLFANTHGIKIAA